MSPRARRTAPLILLLLILGGTLGISGSAGAQTAPSAIRLDLNAPASINAGTESTVSVAVSGFSRNLVVTLTVDGSFGPRLYEATAVDGVASFRVPGSALARTGIISLFASAGSASARGVLEVLPGAPVPPVEPLVGSRSIVADGVSWSMAVAAPVDALGNPVADGTTVTVHARRPDGRRETWDVSVAHLLAWTRIVSGQFAGRTTVGMTALDATGPDASFDETPGWPVDLTLNTLQADPPADGHTLVTVQTGVMKDQYGNVVSDGTAVTFVVRDPDGTERRIPSYVVSGISQTTIQAPTEPGTMTVRATVGDISSGELSISFVPGPAIGTFPVVAAVDPAAGVVTLTAGPILGELNTFVPTGTTVTFNVNGGSQTSQTATATTNAGYAAVTFRLADLPPGDYSVVATAGTGSGSTEFTVGG